MPHNAVTRCLLCEVLRTSVTLAVCNRRLAHFLRVPCRCTGTPHRVLRAHPHTQAGCLGYPWQWHPQAGEEGRDA